jgi:nicotinate-nucleotide adenylyltransferase
MRIGVFGGTFDPPHFGHQILAVEAMEQAQLQKILWVLTPDPPHKQGLDISPAANRLAMVEKMVKRATEFEISDVELNRPGPHYAVDTMRLLRKEYPGDELFYIMGGDSLRDLPTWHAPVEFVDSCDGILVLRRPGARINLPMIYGLISKLRGKVTFLHAPMVEISAFEIRARYREHRDIWQFLLPDVYHYIVHESLYT